MEDSIDTFEKPRPGPSKSRGPRSAMKQSDNQLHRKTPYPKGKINRTDFRSPGQKESRYRSEKKKNMDRVLFEDKLEADKSEFDTYEAAMGEDIYGHECLQTSARANKCRKHPGHKDFIPIKEFTIDHLPDDCVEKEEYFDHLNSWADRVVHISALNVSTERPEKFPLFKRRGGCVVRDGSGSVSDLYLCGQSGEGVEVVSDVLEKFLDECKLIELDAETFESSYYSLFHSTKPEPFIHFLYDCIKSWLEDNLQGFAPDHCRDNFTIDLIHQIQTCKDSQDFDRTDRITQDSARSATTLNEFRKNRSLSVSDFCVALSHGLIKDSFPYERRFWETYGPLIDKPCPCCECECGNSKKTWWLVVVQTAAHVIFDGQESEAAVVSLFYDDDVSERVAMRGINFTDPYLPDISERAKDDGSYFLCSLHDDEAGRKLKSNIDSRSWQSFNIPFSLKERSMHVPTAVIAHPHGSSKHISVGTGWWASVESGDKEHHKNRHTAPTCPGSSGGPVLRLNDSIHPHSSAVTTHLSKCGCHWNLPGYPLFHSQR